MSRSYSSSPPATLYVSYGTASCFLGAPIQYWPCDKTDTMQSYRTISRRLGISDKESSETSELCRNAATDRSRTLLRLVAVMFDVCKCERFLATVRLRDISGSHGDEYEDVWLLECSAV
jgi:hypothetical protein